MKGGMINMNTDISKIKKGDRIPNYRKACELMNEPVLTGNAKVSQLKRWETVMNMKKDGNALIIEEIYTIPLSKEDKRTQNRGRSIFVEHVKIQIINYLNAQNKRGGINFEFVPQPKLYELLGMVNKKYLDINFLSREAIENFVEDHPNQYTVFDVEQFLRYTRGKNKSVLRYALDSLQREKMIIWHQKYRYKKAQFDNLQFVSTDEEDGQVMKVKRDLIKMLAEKEGKENKIKTEQDIHIYGLADRFYKILNNQLLKQFGWASYQVGFQITFHADSLPEEIKFYERNLKELEVEKKTLNSKIHADIVRNANVQYGKYKGVEEEWERTIAEYQKRLAEYERQQRTCWGEPSTMGKPQKPKKPFYYRYDFVEKQTELANYYVDL
jgi:hypothetical protein